MGKVMVAGYERLTGNYVRALQEAGTDSFVSLRVADVENCDALVLPGGGDIAPDLPGISQVYVDLKKNCLHQVDRNLDRVQLAILDRAVQRQIPVLGVCKGHQLIALYFGGSLYCDLPEAKWHEGQDGEDARHMVQIVPGSQLSKVYPSQIIVNSWHHQAVACPGKHMTVNAWWRGRHLVIEGMEHETLPIWSVQWHPERLSGSMRTYGMADGEKIIHLFKIGLEEIAK